MPNRKFVLALAAPLVLFSGCGEPPPPEAPDTPLAGDGARTVVLISIDTLRPERLGVYGNTDGPFPVSPRIDELAQQAVVFEQCLAGSPWTLPSHMTMLTGLDPITHGVKNRDNKLSPKAPTLAASLKADGFSTAAFTDGGYVDSIYGFDRGFDVFDDQRAFDGSPNGFERLLPKALDWLQARRSDEDVFLFLHTFDVHAPFQEGDDEVIGRFREREVPDGPRDWGLNQISHFYQQTKMGLGEYRRMSELLNDYDAGVFEADRGVGRVLDTLAELDRFDEALVIITSDHGESFFDHGLHIGHGLGLYDDELRVPLIVRFPRGVGGGARRPELIGLVDVARTVLDVVGIEPDSVLQGESLTGLLTGRKRSIDYVLGASQNIRAWYLVQNGYKYITPVANDPIYTAERHLGPTSPRHYRNPIADKTYTLGEGESLVELTYDEAGDPLGLRDVLPAVEQLFDRSADPQEHHDIALTQPEILGRMRNLFQSHHTQSDELNQEFFDPEETPEPDMADARVLAALGYLGGNEEDLRAMPLAMRSWVTKPWVAPDTTLLKQGDQLVQRVRAHMRDGKPPTLSDKEALEEAGAHYASWLGENKHLQRRVVWRALDVLELARLDGFTLDTRSWSRDIPPEIFGRLLDEPETPAAPPGGDTGQATTAAPTEGQDEPAAAGADPDGPPR